MRVFFGVYPHRCSCIVPLLYAIALGRRSISYQLLALINNFILNQGVTRELQPNVLVLFELIRAPEDHGRQYKSTEFLHLILIHLFLQLSIW